MAGADEAEPRTETTNDESSGGSASEPLRQLSLPQQRLGGYARDAVDETIARAARTIERLQAEAAAGHEEVARLQAAQVKLQDELKAAARRSAQEIVGDVLVTAHRAAESVIEEARRQAEHEQEAARREALQLLARAQELLAEAAATNRDAHAVVADARARAQVLIAAGAAEANAHVARATESAARRQAQLEVENARLETAIKGLRNEWVGRAAEALARLDRVETGRSLGAAGPEPAGGEVVRDLQTRVQETRTAPAPSRPPE